MAPTDVQFVPDWALLNTVQDEVKDAWRVQKQGQEEDLRDALGRVLKRVEEMVSSIPLFCREDGLLTFLVVF